MALENLQTRAERGADISQAAAIQAGVPGPLTATQTDLNPQKESLLSSILGLRSGLESLQAELVVLRDSQQGEIAANEAYKKDVVDSLKRICDFVGLK